MNKFDYDDINLIPKYCIIDSRSDCDTSIQFGNFKFKNPIVPANMQSVISEELAIKLATEGYFYIMHRFDVDIITFISKMKTLNLFSSISIGVNQDSYELLDYLKNNDLIPDYICIDVAHGHSKKMKHMIKYIKELLPSVFIIAGNVSTIEGTVDLDKWGADAIKVGIGPGSACTTYPTTGFGSRGIQAFCVNQCAMVTKKYIIADGGIKSPADITKSIVLGASMVMVGGMLSSFIDSPGKVIETNGKLYKEFYGSASQFQSKKTSRIEGTIKLNELKNMSLTDYLEYLSECLQSSISYGGGNKLDDLYSVKWI
jgi:GMP reductase